MFKDAYQYVRSCDKCQLFSGRPYLAVLPLKPVIVEEPFRQWGIDFIGPLNPPSSAGDIYILTATDYFTKWVEAIPTKKANSQVVCDFLMNFIFVRFGVPIKIVADNATYFSSEEISTFCYEHGVALAHSSDYFPQGNGQAESSNKNLIVIMKKLMDDNPREWHKKLHEALWADRITLKRAIGMSPFELVYGIGAHISLPLELSSAQLQAVIEDEYFKNPLERRIMHLSKLEEDRENMVDHITEHQLKVKQIFDMRARPRGFMVGDEVLLWDKRRASKGAHGKFESLWKGPFIISENLGSNAFKLSYPDGVNLPFTYNGQDLKLCKL